MSKHDISKEGLLTPWELDIAHNVRNYGLHSDCRYLFENRIRFKYFVMGLNLLLMFLVASNNTLVGFKILEQLSLGELAMVAIYLPQNIRRLISQSKTLLNNMIQQTKLNLSLERISNCLIKSKKSLLLEHLSLQPFKFKNLIDVLDFTTSSFEIVSFNPVLPLLAADTNTNILYIYCYSKIKRARSILFHRSFDRTVTNMSWSENGLSFYTINALSHSSKILYLYSVKKSNYKCSIETQITINPVCTSSYLWVNNNTILFIDSKVKLNTYTIDTATMKFIDFDLNSFDNISSFCCLKNKCYFVASCHFKNTDHIKYHTNVFEFDFEQRKITNVIHIPGKVVNMATNNSILVFVYISDNRLQTCKNATLYPFTIVDDDCPYTQTSKPNMYMQSLMVGIYNGKSLDIRKLDPQ